MKIKTISKIIIVSSFLFIFIFGLAGCGNTGKGEHMVQATAIETQGILFKTSSVYVKTDISSSQEDKYCVENSVVMKKLEGLAKTRQKFTLNFHTEFFVPPWRCSVDDTAIVDSVSDEQGIANPASVYCEGQGGKLNIVTKADGSQEGLCTLKNGAICDEWQFYRGECN